MYLDINSYQILSLSPEKFFTDEPRKQTQNRCMQYVIERERLGDLKCQTKQIGCSILRNYTFTYVSKIVETYGYTSAHPAHRGVDMHKRMSPNGCRGTPRIVLIRRRVRGVRPRPGQESSAAAARGELPPRSAAATARGLDNHHDHHDDHGDCTTYVLLHIGVQK